jgi:general secretion pathway protein G
MIAHLLSGCLKRRDENMSRSHPEGFTLLEMMVVITMILIVASIVSPIYTTSKVHAREAVLHDDLYTLRFLIERFTLDHGRAPASLDEIVEKGYLARLPTDPFTGSNETWQVEMETEPASATDSEPGVAEVHSGAEGLSLDGTPYSEW